MSKQSFAQRAFPTIGKAHKVLVSKGFTVEQADTMLNVKGTKLGDRFSTACTLLKSAA